jgi:hypothetical protein
MFGTGEGDSPKSDEYDLAEGILKTRLELMDRKLEEVPKNGACFYSAASKQLAKAGHHITWNTLHQMMMTYLENASLVCRIVKHSFQCVLASERTLRTDDR